MKILLLYPYCLEERIHEEDASVMPMGLYYIGALLKENGYAADIVNLHGFQDKKEKIRTFLQDHRPDVIGFSVLNANRWGAVEMAEMARAILPDAAIVFGGPGATFLCRHLLEQFACIDFIIKGEGEYAFLQLVRSLEKKDPDAMAGLHGLAFRKEGQIVENPPAPPIQKLDELPNPARFFTYQHLSLTRGCPADCSFCGSPKFWGRKVRYHSPDYFVEQIERLYKQGITFFFVSDDTFTLSKSRVIAVCQKIIEKQMNISWAAISRVDCVDEERLYWMRKAGCSQISYGVESGSEAIRTRVLNKKITDDQIKNAFSLTHQYGIMARAYFIYGSPGDTPHTLRETMNLLDDIKPLSAIFYLLSIFPGTRLYDDLKKQGRIDDGVWQKKVEDLPWFEYDETLSQEAVLGFGQKLRNHFYTRLPAYAEALTVKEDRKELHPLFADFFSKLAMTFTHGDYAGIEAIPDKPKTAEGLYRRALNYAPDHRAFWGLGMLMQSRRDFSASTRMLKQGMRFYPDSEALHICLALNYMNTGDFHGALKHLSLFKDSKQAVFYMAQCYQALGETEKAEVCRRRLNSSD